MKKKILSIILAITMVLSVIPMGLLTASAGFDGELFTVVEGDDYETLAEAIANVPNGGIVKLNDDATSEGVFVSSGKEFTLDLNNRTLTFNAPGAGSSGTGTQALHLENASTVIKNGTINIDESNLTYSGEGKPIKMMIQSYGDLKLENVIIDSTNMVHNVSGGKEVAGYVVSTNCGNLEIKGSVINAKSSDFAFDSYLNKSYSPAPAVTVVDSEINGKVEATGGSITLGADTILNGQLRVGENKDGGAKGSVVTIENGATVNGTVAVFGQNTLNIAGEVNGYVATNGNAYNAGSVINVLNGAEINGTYDATVYIPNGTLNVSGGTINGCETGGTAVYFKAGTLNVTGGTLKGTGAKKEFKHDNNGCNGTGDALVVESCNYPSGIDKVSIAGGSFESANGAAVAGYTYGDATPETGFITDGTFKGAVAMDEALVDEDCKLVANDDGTYGIVEKDYVAKIDGKGYETLAEAIEAVGEGKTITLISDTLSQGISVPSGKDFTLDLNEKTLTFGPVGAGSTNTKTIALQLLKDSDITITNGNIRITPDNLTYTGEGKPIKMLIQNYANLTLLDVDIDTTNINGTGRYAISNNYGETIIEDSKIAVPSGDFAFDSYNFVSQAAAYPTPADVTVKNSEINGKVEATGGALDLAAGTILNGQLRVGENKDGGATGSVVTIENGATVNGTVAVFGQNTLNIAGEVNGYVATNGNAYNAGSVINVLDGAEINGTYDATVYIPNGTLNVSGGVINGCETGGTAVYFKAGTLNVTGGTLKGTGAKKEFKHDNNGCNGTGDALVVESCNYPSGIDKVSIAGGSFESENGAAVAGYTYGDATSETGFITGGTFKGAVAMDATLVAEGFSLKDNGDGTYGVIDDVKPVANWDETTVDGLDYAVEYTYVEVGSDNYKDWYVDFTVSADKAVPAGAVKAAGCYGKTGLISYDGFAMNANEEYKLIETATGKKLKYSELLEMVESFTCGLENVALTEETTFTIQIVLFKGDESFVVDGSKVVKTFGAIVKPVATYEDVTIEGLDQAVKYSIATEGSARFNDYNADIVITANKDVAEGAVILKGKYGTYDLTALPECAMTADTPISLISALGADVTYKDLVKSVKEFTCGIENVALTEETTFTIQIVLSKDDDSFVVEGSEVVKTFTAVDDLEEYKEEKIDDIKDFGNEDGNIIPDVNKDTQAYKDVIAKYEDLINNATSEEEIDNIKAEALKALDEFVPDPELETAVKANDGGEINVEVKLDPAKSTKYYIATVTIANANGKDASGNWFVYWVDDSGKIVSTYSTYSFFVTEGRNLTAVYVPRTQYNAEREKGILVTRILDGVDNGDGTATLYAEHSASKAAVGDEILQHGILYTTDSTQIDNLTVENAGNNVAIHSATADKTANALTGLQRVTLKANGANTIYAKSYITDAEGVDHYGELETITVSDTASTQSVSVNSLESTLEQVKEIIPTPTEEETANLKSLFMNIVNAIVAFVEAIINLF